MSLHILYFAIVPLLSEHQDDGLAESFTLGEDGGAPQAEAEEGGENGEAEEAMEAAEGNDAEVNMNAIIL